MGKGLRTPCTTIDDMNDIKLMNAAMLIVGAQQSAKL